MQKFWTLFKHDFIALLHSPGSILMLVGFPIIVTLLMGFLFDSLYVDTFVSSYDYYGVTMVFFGAMMAATIPANVFLERHSKSGNTRIFYTPVSRVSVYCSKMLACFLFMSACLVLVVILFQSTSFVNFGGSNIFYVIILLIAYTLFLVTLSSAICVTLRSEQMTNIIISNTTAVLGLLSGLFFPIASLGALFETISSYSPVTWTMNTVFALIYDGSSSQYWWIILGLLVIAVLLGFVVHKNYHPEDYI